MSSSFIRPVSIPIGAIHCAKTRENILLRLRLENGARSESENICSKTIIHYVLLVKRINNRNLCLPTQFIYLHKILLN